VNVPGDSFTIVNAVIFDGHAVLDADSLTVTDGVLTSVGPAPGTDADTGPRRIIDAAGGLVTPGFVDAHAHPVFAGVEALALDLTGATDAGETLAMIRAALEKDAATDLDSTIWLTGGGWSMSDFPGGAPTAAQLDALCAEVGVDRPIQLASADHHSTWVNTRALQIAGLVGDVSTGAPDGGVIDRDADGHPTGTLHESAVDLVGAHVPTETPEQLRAGILEGQRRMHEVGVTGWIDAIVGEYLGHGDNFHAYLDAEAEGVLTAEVTGSLWWGRDIADPVAEAERMATLKDRADGPRFRATNVKFMLDGIVESLTAAVTEPYLEHGAEPARHCACEAYVDGPGHGNNHGHNHGTSYFTADHLAASVTAVQRAGFDAHFHAIGDAAVRGALDALTEAAEVDTTHAGRHHIAHLQIVDPTDIPRFADLGVTANLQALWAHYDEQLVALNLPVLGAGREGWLYPFGDLARAGASFAMGSDWPVSSPDPWEAIHVAVNRTHPDGARDEPLGTRQNLDVLTCLRAYTSGSADLARTRTAGRMVVGAPADLALASSDPFDLERADPGALHTVTNTFTVAAGRIVHDRIGSARPESARPESARPESAQEAL
jgi:predicted amidohydrolase YtcJ